MSGSSWRRLLWNDSKLRIMGEKGAKLSGVAALAVQGLLHNLEAIEEITSRKMFGGYGIFFRKKMFSIVDSNGVCFLKINEENQSDFEAYRSPKHAKMPYAKIPEEILDDQEKLLVWAQKAIAHL